MGLASCALTLGLFCTVKYYFVAHSVSGCDLISGTVKHNLTAGKAKAEFLDETHPRRH